jgi:hypothetical protein
MTKKGKSSGIIEGKDCVIVQTREQSTSQKLAAHFVDNHGQLNHQDNWVLT